MLGHDVAGNIGANSVRLKSCTQTTACLKPLTVGRFEVTMHAVAQVEVVHTRRHISQQSQHMRLRVRAARRCVNVYIKEKRQRHGREGG